MLSHPFSISSLPIAQRRWTNTPPSFILNFYDTLVGHDSAELLRMLVEAARRRITEAP